MSYFNVFDNNQFFQEFDNYLEQKYRYNSSSLLNFLQVSVIRASNADNFNYFRQWIQIEYKYFPKIILNHIQVYVEKEHLLYLSIGYHHGLCALSPKSNYSHHLHYRCKVIQVNFEVAEGKKVWVANTGTRIIIYETEAEMGDWMGYSTNIMANFD